MRNVEILDEALDSLTAYYEKGGNAYTSSRNLAYAFIFGATASALSKSDAEYIARVVREYLKDKVA